ncbi:hypothetical protein M3Y99_00717200 [Aphelenchoides fujianensis]|nr:hypothetical protein M3Y99_00717200 [Aphelenchoides fujianensis]
MEPKSENGSTNGDAAADVCNRGTRCKFYHPPTEAAGGGEESKEDFAFCIDYQNQGCYRENCRFVHAPTADVERFRATGDISNALARAIAAVTKKDNINGIPFCKEFQSGRCSRGARCRYWHVNIEAERERRLHGGGPPPLSAPPFGALRPQPGGPPPMGAAPPLMRRRPGEPLDYGPPPSKRFPPLYDAPMGPPPLHAPLPGAGGTQFCAQHEQQIMELRRELEQTRRDLEHERQRYDALLSAFPAASSAHPQQQSQQSAIQQRASSSNRSDISCFVVLSVRIEMRAYELP